MRTWKLSILFALLTLGLMSCKNYRNAEPRPEASEPQQLETTETLPGQKDNLNILPMAFYIDPGAEEPMKATRAVAIMRPTEGSDVTGLVKLADADNGVQMIANFSGLTPEKKHAFHVHLLGDCTGDDGKTAGTHFNFKGSAKNPPADIDRITGNLGEIMADKEGNGSLEATIADASLQGKFSIIGRSIIIHQKPNDPKSPPIGAAGGRLACGVIGVTE